MEKLRKAILNGELYDATNQKLFEERQRCKDLCFELNTLKPSEIEKRNIIVRKILAKTGKNFTIEQPFMCDYGYNIEIGENFYSNHNLIILDCNKVKIGNNVFIGPNVSFFCPEHPLDFQTRNKALEKALPITVCDNVWIGGNVTVLGGVKIGEGAVIGAGSVVTKDVRPNTVVAGNPAKIIKEINTCE